MSGINAATSLCLHLEGANNSTTITDSSPNAYTKFACKSEAKISTAQFKFGSASLFCGAGGALSNGIFWNEAFTSPATFVLGTGDFVIDFWVRLTTDATCNLFDFRGNSFPSGFYPEMYYVGGAAFHVYVNGADRIVGGSMSINTWYHIAWVRSSGVSRLFQGGVQIGSDYTDAGNYTCDSSGPFFGADAGGDFVVQGYMDEIRIQKGTADGMFAGFTPRAAAYSLDTARQNRMKLLGVG